MNKKNALRAISTIVTIAGVLAGLASNWVADKEMKQAVDEGIDEALAERGFY